MANKCYVMLCYVTLSGLQNLALVDGNMAHIKLQKNKKQLAHSISNTKFYKYFVKIYNPVIEHINIVADDFINNVPLYKADKLDTLYDELNKLITIDEVTKAIKVANQQICIHWLKHGICRFMDASFSLAHCALF